jgi:ribosomal protein S18 acetylase RimI-like enzyme
VTADRLPDDSVLDNPVWAALTGPHEHLAEVRGRVRRYPTDVSPFVALPPGPSDQDWHDLAALAGPGGHVGRIGELDQVPDGWHVDFEGVGVQLVATAALETGLYDEAVALGAADADEMMTLVERTRPGPFLPRTYLLGGYLGVRRDGRLVAMAGQRLHPPGFTEISAVCTDPDFRGQGFGTRLVQAVAHTIRARGETPMMHAAATNTNAIRLYEALGFRVRREVRFAAATAP